VIVQDIVVRYRIALTKLPIQNRLSMMRR